MKTTIDYLAFRSQADPKQALEGVRGMFGTLGPSLRLKPLERGAMGFQQAAQIVVADMPVARIDYGGESQRGWLRAVITGKGCEWVQDWDAVEQVEALPAAEIRRLDIALTTWEGQVKHDTVVQAHAANRFQTGGRPPDLQQITSSNPIAGRTCYIGKRESDKFFRAYEKGYEMAAKFRTPGQTVAINGFPIEDIYRCELELKAKGTPIGWDVIDRRDQYFAGAYPFCADVLPGIEADILQRRKERAPQTDLAVALKNCRIQFGATLFTALMAYEGDMTAVWDKIIGKSHCQALLEAGVLLVDHE